jgi:hypothetical protein
VASRIELPPGIWAEQLGWAVAVLTLVGLLWMAAKAVRGPLNGLWAAVSAMAISASVFPALFGVWERRHQVEAAPAFVLLAAAGAWLVTLGPVKAVPVRARAGLAVAIAVFAVAMNLPVPRQVPQGYASLAASIVAGRAGPSDVVLIVGTASGEGALIAEIAQQEQRPGRYILRATKLLAEMSWLGRNESLKANTADQVRQLLESIPIDMVVLDDGKPAPFDYLPLLQQALAEHPRDWALWRPEGGRFSVYQRRNQPPLSKEQREIRLVEVAGIPDF